MAAPRRVIALVSDAAQRQQVGLYHSKLKARDVGIYEPGCGWR
jgi:hypothetical protein